MNCFRLFFTFYFLFASSSSVLCSQPKKIKVIFAKKIPTIGKNKTIDTSAAIPVVISKRSTINKNNKKQLNYQYTKLQEKFDTKEEPKQQKTIEQEITSAIENESAKIKSIYSKKQSAIEKMKQEILIQKLIAQQNQKNLDNKNHNNI